jgi:hypothetical protein
MPLKGKPAPSNKGKRPCRPGEMSNWRSDTMVTQIWNQKYVNSSTGKILQFKPKPFNPKPNCTPATIIIGKPIFSGTF